MHTYTLTRVILISLLTAAFIAPATAAWSAALRIKIVTVYSDDPNDLGGPVGAVKVKIGGVTAITGDGTDALLCLGGSNFRLPCAVDADCPESTCGNPGDNNGDGFDDEDKGVARTTVSSGTHVVGVPSAELLDEFGSKYRVGFIVVSETVTGFGQTCPPDSKPEGNVAFQFNEEVDHSSQSDYTVAIRIVPLAAPALTGVEKCAGGDAKTTKALNKCKLTVAKASADFVQTRFQALAKCEDAKHAGDLPANLDCRTETVARAKIEKENAALRKAIGKACGGVDKTCGGDTTAEFLPPALGFPNVCPGFLQTGCTNPINDCSGLADCLVCIDAMAVDRTMTATAAVGFADPKLQKQLNKCQRTITKAATTYALALSKGFHKCYEKRQKLPVADEFGNTLCTRAALDALGDDFEKFEKAVCKACGGSEEKGCGGVDDFTPNQIGFPMTCPNIAGLENVCPPDAFGAITTLDGIMSCAACNSLVGTVCTSDLPVPSLAGVTYLCG